MDAATQPFPTVSKRDGRSEAFDAARITAAIAKAGAATGEFGPEVAASLRRTRLRPDKTSPGISSLFVPQPDQGPRRMEPHQYHPQPPQTLALRLPSCLRPRQNGERGSTSWLRPEAAILKQSLPDRLLGILRSAGIAYEVRTTVCQGLHDTASLGRLADDLRPGERWFLRAYRGVPDADSDLLSPAAELLTQAHSRAQTAGIHATIR
jgi:hypothetical protein